MTQEKENILTKRVNGLTWGVIFTALSSITIVEVSAFKMYVGIMQRIDQTYYDSREYKRDLDAKYESINKTLDRHESQLQQLIKVNQK